MEADCKEKNPAPEESSQMWMAKSGYLSLKITKGQSVIVSNWFNKRMKRYWFVLHEMEKKLLYFSTRSDSLASSNPCGTIDLCAGQVFLKDDKEASFLLSIGNREYTLVAESKSEKKSWIENLHGCIPDLQCTLSPELNVKKPPQRSASVIEKVMQQTKKFHGHAETPVTEENQVPRAKRSDLRRSRSITYPPLNFPDSDLDEVPSTRTITSSANKTNTKVKTKWFVQSSASEYPTDANSSSSDSPPVPYLGYSDSSSFSVNTTSYVHETEDPSRNEATSIKSPKEKTALCPLREDLNSRSDSESSKSRSYSQSTENSSEQSGEQAPLPGAKVSDYVAIDPHYLATVMLKNNPGMIPETAISPEKVKTFEDLDTLRRALESSKNVDYSAVEYQQRLQVLESEVNRLKCEVLSLIEGSMKYFVPDEGIGEWHVVEEVQHKDRIVELLMDAREENPSLPQCVGRNASSFTDKYGFRHGSREQDTEFYQFICRELMHHYSAKFKHRDPYTQLWTEYLRVISTPGDNIHFNAKELHKLIRAGIPSQYRKVVWKRKCMEKVQHIVNEKGSDYYEKLCEKLKAREGIPYEEMSETEKLIRLDLLRTMPTNERFKHLDSDGVIHLSRILNAYSVEHNPSNGYLQGMNFIVALFLLFMEEKDAFWCLIAVVEVYLKDYYDEILSGCQADQELLKDMLRDELPSLDAHLKSSEVDISVLAFSWFITIFIDAVPLETLLRIWDCFLFEGSQVLFRISLAVLKINQSALVHVVGPISIIQYIKHVFQVTYDADYLMKIAWDDLKTFPPVEVIDERHDHYLGTFTAQQKDRSQRALKRRESRVSSLIVDVPSEEKNSHQISLECAAVTASDNLDEPPCVWLCCGTKEANSYLSVLDVAGKEMHTLNEQIKSRILCCLAIPEHIVLIGTLAWNIHAFSTIHRSELWRIQLSDSITSMSYDGVVGRVFASLADGRIAVIQFADVKVCVPAHDHKPFYIHVGKAPVTCCALVEKHLWCGCGNSIVILDSSSSQFSEIHSFEVSASSRNMVSDIEYCTHGVWSSLRGSCIIFLWDIKTYSCLVKLNLLEPDNNTDQEFEQVRFLNIYRITALLALDNLLWIGLANGTVFICKITYTRNSAANDDAERNVKVDVLQYHRISEDSIRSFLPLSLEENKILSCAHKMGADGCLALWNQGDSKSPDLWYPRLIKCRESENRHSDIEILSRSLTREHTSSWKNVQKESSDSL